MTGWVRTMIRDLEHTFEKIADALGREPSKSRAQVWAIEHVIKFGDDRRADQESGSTGFNGFKAAKCGACRAGDCLKEYHAIVDDEGRLAHLGSTLGSTFSPRLLECLGEGGIKFTFGHGT